MLESKQPEKTDEHSLHPTPMNEFDAEKLFDFLYEFKERELYTVDINNMVAALSESASDECLLAIENYIRKNGIEQFIGQIQSKLFLDWEQELLAVIDNYIVGGADV